MRRETTELPSGLHVVRELPEGAVNYSSRRWFRPGPQNHTAENEIRQVKSKTKNRKKNKQTKISRRKNR